jgi:hypothetical protein
LVGASSVVSSPRNGFPAHTSLRAKGFPIGWEPTDYFKEDAMLKRAAVGLAGLAVAAVFATAASAHMWSGNHHDRRDYYSRSGWHWGMSEGSDSTNLLTRDAAKKPVDDFARKSFPGYRMGKVNEGRFEAQVGVVAGKVIGVYPIEE